MVNPFDQRIVVKAHIKRFEAHAENLAALVQWGGQHRGLRVFNHLFDPAEQDNVGPSTLHHRDRDVRAAECAF